MQEQPTTTAEPRTVLELTAEEVMILRTALKMLRATLGREEAEELHEVEALLARLPAA